MDLDQLESNMIEKKLFLEYLDAYKEAKRKSFYSDDLTETHSAEEEFDNFIDKYFNSKQIYLIFDFMYNEYTTIDTEEDLWKELNGNLSS